MAALFWSQVCVAFAGENKGAVEKPVAEINGNAILQSTFQRELRKALLNLGHGELPPQRMEEIRSEVLDNLIARELIVQQAKKEKVDPNDLVQKEVYSKAAVGEEEVNVYYEKHTDEFMKPEAVRLLHLLVKVDPSGLKEDWKAGYDKALKLREEAVNGEAFTELVQKHSDPEGKDFGGDLSIQYRGKMAMHEFEPVAFALKEKEVSRPIQTLYGFSLIQIVEKISPAPMPFNEIDKGKVKNSLYQEKVNQRVKAWVSELKSKAAIKIFQDDRK